MMLEPEPSFEIRLIEGGLTGDGPWKIADWVITVLGCHGAAPDLASQYAYWQTIAPSIYQQAERWLQANKEFRLKQSAV